MPKSRPYQPLIFRLIHALHGCLVLASVTTGFWMYNTWDHRLVKLPLPEAETNLLSIHHQIGEILTPFVAIFLLYSLVAGRRRLIQPKSIPQLAKPTKPAGQYALHRLVNTGLLGMLLLSMVSARQFGGAKALIQGEWDNTWYNLHVFAWGSIVVLVCAHIMLALKVGGLPLVQSMIATQIRAKDQPAQWPQRLSTWYKSLLNKKE
ncbi:MAG: cytochrome b/b6 domain-containing protein [Cyanobacteria bacterium J06598_3]